MYRGPIVDKLKELNQHKDWQGILGLRRPDKNQKDVELILRLFSLFNNWENYEKPMLRYLNKFMDQNRQFDSANAVAFAERFEIVAKLINENLDKPFRPKKVLNSAVLEAVMITLMENHNITIEQLKANYTALFEDADFTENTTGGTTDTIVLQKRIEVAKRILSNGSQ